MLDTPSARLVYDSRMVRRLSPMRVCIPCCEMLIAQQCLRKQWIASEIGETVSGRTAFRASGREGVRLRNNVSCTELDHSYSRTVSEAINNCDAAFLWRGNVHM